MTGLLTDKVRVNIRTICGPRAAVLEVNAGLLTDELARMMMRNDCVKLAQFVPWDAGDVTAFTRGRWLRCEATWPAAWMDTMVRLRDLPELPRDRVGRWVLGINEHGSRVTASLRDASPHALVAGTTGSGKSTALKVAAVGLSKTCRLVLVDGKRGESLLGCQGLPGVVGPVATDLETAKDALGWTLGEMNRRYDRIAQGDKLKFLATEDGLSRLVVIFDEFQAYTSDSNIAEMMAILTAQGRAAGVHMVAATHHPVVDAFGESSTPRELVMRYALRVTDAKASQVALGVPVPRADKLAMNGDGWLLSSSNVCHRVQGAWIDDNDLEKASTSQPELECWPEFVAEDVGQARHTRFTPARPDELALAIRAAKLGAGRPTLIEMFENEGLDIPGTDRMRRIMRTGADVWAGIREHVCD